MPIVSVVIPLYNSEAWIADTLQSVLAQETCGWEYEIIIVDDGSTDNGPAVVAEVLRKATIPWRIIATPNGGPSKARNVGWRSARGEWIQFLDADDLLHPQKLLKQIRHVETKNAEAAVVYSPWCRFQVITTGCIQRFGTVIPEVGRNPVAELLRSSNFVAVGSYIIRKQLLLEVGGWDESCWLIEDVHLLLRVAASGGGFQYAHSEEPLLLYRQHGENSLSHRRTEFIDGIVRNTMLAEKVLKRNGGLGEPEAKILADCYSQAVSYYMGVSDARAVELSQQVTALVPKFIPDGPSRFRIVARVVGYRRAIQLGSVYRRLMLLLLSR